MHTLLIVSNRAQLYAVAYSPALVALEQSQQLAGSGGQQAFFVDMSTSGTDMVGIQFILDTLGGHPGAPFGARLTNCSSLVWGDTFFTSRIDFVPFLTPGGASFLAQTATFFTAVSFVSLPANPGATTLPLSYFIK
jgi:hypothetical protein